MSLSMKGNKKLQVIIKDVPYEDYKLMRVVLPKLVIDNFYFNQTTSCSKDSTHSVGIEILFIIFN